jgi:signal transduction histidine kinase
VSRVPITVRLTAVFAAVTAAILAATGLYLHARLRDELNHSVRDTLRSRADDVAALVHRGRPGPRGLTRTRLTEAGESFFQIIDARGRVVGGTRAVGRRPLLSRGELERARRTTILTDRAALPHWDEDRLRLLATPIAVKGGRHVVAVVGMSTEDVRDALQGHAGQLLIGGPVALLLATLTAFALARAALRPVESLRRQAAEISAAEPGRRLPLPNTRDELFRLGETLNEMLARLEGALLRERAFVSDAGHELRTPLTILKTELQLATRHGHTTEELREAVRSAAEETDRLVTIAEDLLVIARSDHEAASGRHELTDVADVVATVLARFRGEASRRARELEAAAPTGLLVVADRLALERALGNMLDNALRHGQGDVLVAAAAREGQVELHVLDQGPGFPEVFVAHAFERFTRADAARSRGGSGLGLAVVQSVAAAHGGSTGAARRPDGGADVWLSLPLAADTVARAPDEPRARVVGLAPSPLGS